MADETPAAFLDGVGPALSDVHIPLGFEPLRLGRGSENQITLTDPMISRLHAEIRFQAGVYLLRDLGSTHGTFVNGERVQEAGLADGSRIRLGNSEFVFRLAQDAIPTALLGATGVGPPSTDLPHPLAPPAPRSPAPPPAHPSAPPASASAENGPPPAGRRRSNRLLIGCAIAAVLACCGCLGLYLASVVAESSGGLSAALDELADGGAAGYREEDLAAALAVALPDERPQILERLGRPDEFDLSVVQVEGGQVRLESWRYYGFGTRVDFVDGAIVWMIDLEPVSEASVFPAWYDPTAFVAGMSIPEASALAAAASPTNLVPQQLDLSEGGEDLAGALMLLGDQIMLGFEEDRLVYVETIGATLAEVAQ